MRSIKNTGYPTMNTAKPNLFLGGVQKSGTTSLHYFLAKHPDIFIPEEPEELHFFDVDENYSQGIDWYLSHFASYKGEKIIAQTSPLYIYDKEVPQRIKEFNPDAKFIFILRNPVDRAYSHYWNSVRFGYENLSFKEAIEQEPERINKNKDYRRHYSYVDRGRYAEQLSRFFELFPRENILVLLFDDLKKSYADIGNFCGNFLDIDADKFVYSEEKQSVRNKAQVPRFNFLQQWIGKQYERRSKNKAMTIPLLVRVVEKINFKNVKYTPMEENTRLKLLAEFENEIVDLQEMLNLDLQNWLSVKK